MIDVEEIGYCRLTGLLVPG